MKTKLLFLLTSFILLFTAVKSFSQATPTVSLTQSTACTYSGCNAKDLTITNSYIGNIDGTPLDVCTAGNATTAYLFITVDTGPKYNIYVQFDLYWNNVKVNTNGKYTYAEPVTGTQIPIIPINIAQINFSCGDKLELRNIYVAWKTGGSTNIAASCASESVGSKCTDAGFIPNIIVNTPLAVDFMSNNSCTGGAFEQVTFTNSSTGGDGTLTYLWDFGAGASPATANTAGPHTVTYTSGGSKTVSLKVTDTDGDFDTKTKTISVAACCTTPVIANKTTSICSGSPFSVSPVNGGSEVVPSGTTYSWSAPSVSGITGTLAGTNAPNISGTLINSTTSPINVPYTVTPKSGTCTGTPFTVTVTVNPKPTATISGTTNVCKDATAPNITFTGAAGTAPYTFTYKINGGSDLTVTTTTGNSVTVAAPTNNTGTFIYSLVSVKDASSTTCSQAQTGSAIITVNDPPTATISGDLSACLTTTLTANTNASSPTYVWYKNNVIINGQTASTLVVNTNGDYKVKVTNGVTLCETTSAVSTVVVEDVTKPVKPTLADVTGECTATATAPTTTDNCAGTITATTNDPLTYNTQGTHVITWTFDDGNGNVETVTQNVIIKDVTKPVKPTLADVTGECTATATAPTTTDNCAGTITATTNDPLTYNTQGTHVITWTFDDGNGNVETATQNVIIKDVTKPVKPVLADVTGECTATATAPTTTDNCAGTITATTNDPLTYNTQGTHVITWTFDDGNGNVETATQNVIIKDVTKPVKPTLADVTGECTATATAPTTTDNCAGTITATTNDPLTYNTQGTHVITWTFDDGNGNVETATQNVIIKDVTKPVKPVLADVTGECTATATAPTTTDNCAGTITATTNDPLTYNTQGTHVITWTFDDGNGNVETATQNVIIKDVTKPVKPVLADVTGECTATATAPTTTDNCAGTITATTNDPLTYTTQGTHIITWTFDDGNGNTETVTQNVIVKDVTKPVKPTLADVTGECTATATAPTTTDNCAGTITATTNDPLTYTTQGTHIITWTFDDGNGNTQTVTQNVIVKDVTKPVKPTLADVTGECTATATAPTTTDNCAGTITATTNDPLTYNTQGTHIITWTFDDGNGNTQTVTQNVIVKDVTKPVKPTLADVTGECTATATAPTTTDNCAGTITATTNDPLTYNTQGTHVITWTFDDGNGNVETATQNVIIKDVTKPVKPTLADVTGECTATATAPTTTDNCAGTITATTNDPLTYNTQGTHVITWTFDDGNGNVETVTQNVIIKDVTKPVKPTLADVTGECTATATAPTTTDNCAGTITATTNDPLTYNTQGTHVITWTFDDGNGNVETATQNVIIKDVTKPVKPVLADVTGECTATATAPTTTDNCAGTITATTNDPLTYNTQGTHVITWTFDDGNGNVETATQNVIIKDVTKPVKPTLADVTGECTATATAPTTTDNCAGTITATTNDPLTYNTQGTHVITWTFDDGNGNVETATQNVIIKDVTKPVKPVLADVTGECTATATAPTTTDNCAGTITATTNDPLTYTTQGTHIITWTFDDGNGNTETVTQNVIVKDVTKPVKPTLADVTGECTATATAPTTTDNCAGTITATTNDPLTYTTQGTHIITWTFDDGNGNTQTVTQNVIVKDVTKPVKPTLADVTGECTATATAPTTTDNCAGTITATTNDPLTYNTQGTHIITWTFDDGNGNTQTVTQNVIVKDVTKPVKPTLADVTGECTATATAPTTTDNCAGTITATTNDPLTYNTQGTHIITWTFDDGNGNTQTVTQNVIVKDVTKPVKPTLADVTGECTATATAPTTTDNCAGTITATTNDPLTYNTQGTHVITWTFDDGNGNTQTVTQNVIVKDVTKPVKPTLADVTGECTATATAPTTTDNCAGTITATTNDPLTYTTQGTHIITWTFDDGNGNTQTVTQNVIVKDVTKPVKPTLADVTGECTATATAPTTTDNCAGTITATTNDPLTYTTQGTHIITWTFDDGNGNTQTVTQNVIVKDVTKPVKPTLADVTGECTATATAPTTTDNCAGTITATTNDPLTYNTQGTHVITWTFDDGNGNVETATQNVIIKDVTKPVKPVLADVTGECTATATAPTTTDNCAGTITATTNDPLTYNTQGTHIITWTFDDGNGNVETATQNVIVKDVTKPVKPTLADVTGECTATATAPTTTDNCAGTITATTNDPLTYNTQGTHIITWTFDDGNGNVETATQNVIVKDVTKPVKPTLADVTGECTATATAPTTTDNCAGTITATTNDPLTYNTQGTHIITWTFDDGNGNTQTVTQNVIVKDVTKPVKPTLADVTGECTATATAPTTTDNCAGTITATTNDPLTYNTQGTHIITWTFDDGNGNTQTVTQNVIVKDVTKPVINGLPAISTIYCPNSPVFVTPTATDNCTVISLTSVDVRTNGTCAGTYSITRTWTATDAGGNTTTASQTINVEDNTAPAPTTAFQTVINTTCAAVPTKPELIFADGCSEIAPVVMYSENVINNSSTSYSIIRKWNVKDACNNTADYIQTVNVNIITNVTTITVPEFINSINGTPVDLTTYLPQDAPSNGIWVDVNNSGLLNGSILDPNNAATGDYTFQYNIETETCPISYVINLKIDQSFVLGCGTILVHNAFTPNGDSFNEKFVIDNIDDTICYPENTVEIYNRWGILVYEAKGYNNEDVSFKGYSEGRVTVDKSAGLPAGTYFYILNYTSVGLQGEIIPNKKQGYLYLTR